MPASFSEGIWFIIDSFSGNNDGGVALEVVAGKGKETVAVA